ncbi:DUF1624 domain-containing protein [Bauldia sp.]|uniref:DUF1624 domain-containing protein n=1 Tax=Bauldia sp. TaxID=2575872 RepID=UPI003BAD33F8
MDAALETRAESLPSRVEIVDVLRGIAILAMIVYHFAWDLSAYRLIATDITLDPWWIMVARLIAGTFIGLVGVNLVLAERNGFHTGRYLRRLAIVALAAGLVSAGTYWFFPNAFVFFGILHCIVVASVLALPFLRAPMWITAAAAIFFLAGSSFLTSPFFNAPGWYWLGLSSVPPVSVDYVPLFPWFGVVLAGVIVGRFITDTGDWPIWHWRPGDRPLRSVIVAGRWSLLIYLVHQPILIGALTLLMPLLGPSQTALAEQLTSEYDASCAVAGYEESACAAYSACILGKLGKEDGLLLAASRHQLTAKQVELWQITVAECRVKTLPPEVAGGI